MDVFEYKRSLDKIKKDLIIKNNIRYIEIPHYFSKEEIVALIRNNSSVSWGIGLYHHHSENLSH